MLPTLLMRFGDATANEASHRTREVMNEAADLMYKKNYLLGVGPNNYAFAVNDQPYADLIDESIREKGHKVDPDYKRGIVESHFWQMKSETGLLGYVSFVVILVLSVLGPSCVTNKDPLYRALMLGIVWSFCGNYAQSTIEHTLVNYTNLYMWALLISLIVITPWRYKSLEVNYFNLTEKRHKNAPVCCLIRNF